MVQLREVLDRIEHCGLRGEIEPGPGQDIGMVTCDSREAASGALFVAIRGYRTDGHRYIDAAIDAGVSVVVCEEFPDLCRPGCVYIRVADARKALAEASRAVYGDASDRLMLIGVTGTNGKTTTARLITAMLNSCGIPAGYIGTGLCRIGDRDIEIDRTTPEAPGLHSLFRQMVDSGCRAAVMEVSSHSLVLKRVHGIMFHAGIFTNLSPEHLDFHDSMSAYAEAKKKMFSQLRPDGIAVVNADDPAAFFMVEHLPSDRVYCCSLADRASGCPPGNRFEAEIAETSVGGSRALFMHDGRTVPVFVGLPGRFNVMNALEAFALGIGLGIGAPAASAALAGEIRIDGRMERIWDRGGKRCAVVDYAHTPDALKKTLETLRQVKPKDGRLLVVFGCGGNRDRSKRPEMGRIASEYADCVILTSDNPRDEDPERILDEIERGVTATAYRRISDREEAIRAAVRELVPGDLLLVAGKGHETYQEIAGEKRFFSDRHVLEECFLLPVTGTVQQEGV
jgi:UDP-N-acetylmuramyl-tripeptide synthetase